MERPDPNIWVELLIAKQSEEDISECLGSGEVHEAACSGRFAMPTATWTEVDIWERLEETMRLKVVWSGSFAMPMATWIEEDSWGRLGEMTIMKTSYALEDLAYR